MSERQAFVSSIYSNAGYVNDPLNNIPYCQGMKPRSHQRKWRSQPRQKGYQRRRNRQDRQPLHFGFTIAALSAVTFGLIFFQEKIPSGLNAAVQFSRNLDRANAPQAGDYFAGCDDARAAGVAPLYSDEPGYRPEMDGDGDGVACEPYR